jgi:hypothetical protein
MFVIFFSTLVIIALLSSCSEVIMRIRLSKRESPPDRLLWWRRGGDEVAAMYEEVFPRTYLPLFRRYVFYLFFVCVFALLIFVLLKRG